MINNCNICGAYAKDILYLNFNDVVGMAEKYTQVVGSCTNCGFIYTKNPFSEEQLKKRYAEFSKYEYKNTEPSKDSLRQKYFIDSNVEKYNSVLEIGAASGVNLSLYNNIKNMGVEPSSLNCISAKERFNVNMYCGTFDDYYKDFPSEKYDLVFLSHTLEHIVNPMDFILKCREINNKYIYIEVPTFDCKFADEPFGMFAEEHVNYFTFEGLFSLMTAAGYKSLDVHMIFGIHTNLPAGWPAIASIWEKNDSNKLFFKSLVRPSEEIVNDYIRCSEKNLNCVKSIIDSIKNSDKLAVWGTGHHASMLLANTSLSKKNIVKFYDSDERKHAHTMNGKSITFFNENDILEGKIDTILIATYTAQKQIQKVLEKYENQCNIVVLYDERLL